MGKHLRGKDKIESITLLSSRKSKFKDRPKRILLGRRPRVGARWEAIMPGGGRVKAQLDS